MTIQWIDNTTLEQKLAIQACTHFKGGHINDKIAAAIYDIHSQYRINVKIVRTYTDNRTNIIEAFMDCHTVTHINLPTETFDNNNDDYIRNNDNMTLTDTSNKYQLLKLKMTKSLLFYHHI